MVFLISLSNIYSEFMLVQDIIPIKKNVRQDLPARKSRRVNKKTRNKLVSVLLIALLVIQIFLPVRMFFDPPEIKTQETRAAGEQWLDDRFRQRVRFDINNSGGLQTECPVLIEINTQDFIAYGEMLDDGRDIRITANNGATLLPFSVLSGINTPATKIGARVDSIPNGTSSIYMYFDYVCESIPNLSDGGFWYNSTATEGSPILTTNENNISIYSETGGSGGSGTAVERFSPTFNALNISKFDFDISAGDTFNVTGNGAEFWINITDGDSIFYEHWYSMNQGGWPGPYDPWSASAEYDASSLTGIHELNLLLHVHYTFSGASHNITNIVTITLTNNPSMSVMDAGQENCPSPLTTETFYIKVGGNDSADGKSYANAWATLNHAFQNVPADQGNIIRIDEGTYNGFEWGFPPARCVNLVGGYWDGSWHDWTENCGHNRSVVVSQGGELSNNDVSFKYLEINASSNLLFPMTGMGYAYRLTDCIYREMIYAGDSTVTIINTDNIFHQATETILPTSVTSEHHIFTVQDPNAFNIFSPRNAKIISDNDIDMTIETWSVTGDQNKQWKIEATGDRTITFQFGDMLADTKYDLKVDSVKISDATSNSLGVITFPAYSGSFSEKTFTTEVCSNTAPTATFNSATQKTDGTGKVDISIEVDDADNDNTCKAKIEYKLGADCSSGTSDPTLDESAGATADNTPAPDIENDNVYQAGTVTPILTSLGSNTVTFDWDSKANVPDANGTYCLKLTVNDGAEDQATPATTTLTLDNVAPTGYTVSTDQSYFNDSNKTNFSFTFASAESGATYNYSIDDTNGGTLAVASSGTISTATDTISNIDVSTLDDDTLTLTVYLTDASGNQGSNVTDTAVKDVVAPANVGISSITADSSAQLTITAQTATDATSGLHSTPYWFNETTGNTGATDSTAWQTLTSFVDSDLSVNTQYTYQTKVKDAAGNESSYSTISSKYTLSNIPSSLSLTADSSTQITVLWSANSNPANTEYYIENSTEGTNSGWTTSTSWISPDLSCGTNYSFKVKSRNGENVNSNYTSSVSIETGGCGNGMPPSAYNSPSPPKATPENPENNFSLAINNGSEYTNDQIVTLKLISGSDTVRMAISNTSDFKYASQIDYQEEIIWDLCEKNGDNPACVPDSEFQISGSQFTVYAKFYTQYGAASETVSVSINYISDLKENDLITGPDGIKVYTINKNNYKRHIFNPTVFGMYLHLKWENIKKVSQTVLDLFETSNLYRTTGKDQVYFLEEIDEIKGKAIKHHLDVTPEDFSQKGYDWNEVFIANKKEDGYYEEGEEIQ